MAHFAQVPVIVGNWEVELFSGDSMDVMVWTWRVVINHWSKPKIHINNIIKSINYDIFNDTI